ncbi:MAG TPA: hypothetical protein VKE41_24805 [Roseiflexaceae bacterium]|nr:hypothetical protein [Roseiflexaceae bacterium]
MANPRKSGDERMVSRTYRAAIRIGEDFITLEETIALPLDASDEEVAQAVELGWRIYRAQREAAEAQVTDMRSTIGAPAPITVRDPDSPASDKQRNYIATLQDNLAWNSEQLAAYAEDQSVDLVTMTKGQASLFIDGLKKLAEERTTYADSTRAKAPASAPQNTRPAEPSASVVQAHGAQGAGPVNEKQIHAMERLAQQQGLDLDMESRRRFGVVAHGLTYDQASSLLRDLQRPANGKRAVNESAL